MARHAVDNSLRSQNTQHRPAATGNLSPSRILNDARAKPKTHRLSLQQQQLVLRLDLQCNLRLAIALPPAQDGRVRRVSVVVFVAREGGMGGLGGDFT